MNAYVGERYGKVVLFLYTTEAAGDLKQLEDCVRKAQELLGVTVTNSLHDRWIQKDAEFVLGPVKQSEGAS